MELKKSSDNIVKLKISADAHYHQTIVIVKTGVTPTEINHFVAKFLKTSKSARSLEFEKNYRPRNLTATTDEKVPLTDELYDLWKEHVLPMKVKNHLSMKNEMSPAKFLDLLNYTNTPLFNRFEIGEYLNRNLCTDEVFLKLVCHEVCGVDIIYCDGSGAKKSKKSSHDNGPWRVPYTCIPDIKVTDCDYVEVDLTDALLTKMAERPDKLPKKIDLGKAITKFSCKGIEALLKALRSSPDVRFDYNFGVVRVENLADIEALFGHTTNEKYRTNMEYSYDKPTKKEDVPIFVRYSDNRNLVMYQSFNNTAEDYFLQKLKTGNMNSELIQECADYSAIGGLKNLKIEIESDLITNFHATHNMQYIKFAFPRFENGKSYNYGFEKYKETLLEFFSSTKLDDPIMIAGREYVVNLPSDAQCQIFQCFYKKEIKNEQNEKQCNLM